MQGRETEGVDFLSSRPLKALLGPGMSLQSGLHQQSDPE